MDPFTKLFASLFSQKNESGDAETPKAHPAQIAAAFSAAVQVLEAGLGEGKDMETELRARAQALTDLAELVAAAKKEVVSPVQE